MHWGVPAGQHWQFSKPSMFVNLTQQGGLGVVHASSSTSRLSMQIQAPANVSQYQASPPPAAPIPDAPPEPDLPPLPEPAVARVAIMPPAPASAPPEPAPPLPAAGAPPKPAPRLPATGME